ncbi:MAG: hypothetical protein ACE5Z5_14780 [Candidatus Bathyarchaeia archaeon]
MNPSAEAFGFSGLSGGWYRFIMTPLARAAATVFLVIGLRRPCSSV